MSVQEPNTPQDDVNLESSQPILPMKVYRYSLEHAIKRVVFSAAGWLMIVGLPGLMIWMITLDKFRDKELLVVAGIVGVFMLCWSLHSRRYWRRFFDRSPQVEFYPKFLRAKELGDTDILWSEVTTMRALEQSASGDVTGGFLIFTLTDDREEEIDVTGLDTPVAQILSDAQTVRFQRT